jgi:hypothetical protein
VPLDEVSELELPELEQLNVRELVRAIRRLPENQRAAVTLREFEGRSYPEIAEALGVTVPAVEALLSRARKTLKRQASVLRGAIALQFPGLAAKVAAVAVVGAVAGAAGDTAGVTKPLPRPTPAAAHVHAPVPVDQTVRRLVAPVTVHRRARPAPVAAKPTPPPAPSAPVAGSPPTPPVSAPAASLPAVPALPQPPPLPALPALPALPPLPPPPPLPIPQVFPGSGI